MPPISATPRLEVYEGSLALAISKRNSVEVFHDFYYAIEEKDKRRLITEVIGGIAEFKNARKTNKPRANQEDSLERLYKIICNITAGDRYRKHVAQREPEEVFTSICTIIKNRSGFFKAEYPETLRYIVERYRSDILLTDTTRGILRCGAPKPELKRSLDQLLTDRSLKIKKAEKALASIRIKNTLINIKDNLAIAYPERKYRYLIAQILEQVSNHFEAVPTAMISNYFEGIPPSKPKLLANLSKEDYSAFEKTKALIVARGKEFTFREELPPLKNGSSYSPDEIEKQAVKNLKASIEKRYGSCNELTQVLIVALLSNKGLPDYIKNNISAFHLIDPDDHVMVGIKDFEGKTLILDAWLRHTNLKATPFYRPEDVKSYDKDRKTGFMGDIVSYSDFLNAHESDRYVRTGVKHQIIEVKGFRTMLDKNINDLGAYLDAELARAQSNQLYT